MARRSRAGRAAEPPRCPVRAPPPRSRESGGGGAAARLLPAPRPVIASRGGGERANGTGKDPQPPRPGQRRPGHVTGSQSASGNGERGRRERARRRPGGGWPRAWAGHVAMGDARVPSFVRVRGAEARVGGYPSAPPQCPQCSQCPQCPPPSAPQPQHWTAVPVPGPLLQPQCHPPAPARPPRVPSQPSNRSWRWLRHQ